MNLWLNSKPFQYQSVYCRAWCDRNTYFSEKTPCSPEYALSHVHWFRAFFAASINNHVQPVVVAEVIKEIIDTNTNQLRHTAGPDAIPLLGWRSSLTDEDWINTANIDQESWANGMKEGLQLNVMAYLDQQIYP